jgi:hypothetical protein
MLSDRIAYPHPWCGRTSQSASTYESVGSSHEGGLAPIEMSEADARKNPWLARLEIFVWVLSVGLFVAEGTNKADCLSRNSRRRLR